MELRIVNDRNVFDSFVMSNTYCHYMKTSMWGEFRRRTEGLKYELLGFYENEKLIATALAFCGSWMMHKYIYVQKGPCVDYENAEQTSEVLKLLKDYADRKHVRFLRVDPNVNRVPHDIQGNVLDGYNNEHVTEEIKALGFIHKGYGYAYNGSWSNRYTLVIDLSDDEKTIISRFSKPRKTSLNRHKVSGVTTRLGTAEDIPSLSTFEKMLSEQDGFPPHSLKFFNTLLECFGEHAVMYVTEISFDNWISGVEGELAGKKYAKDPEARKAKEKNLVQAKELREKYGSGLPIAAGVFLRMGTWSWDLYTYNHKDFNFINCVDNLHSFAIHDMKEHGVIHYDMCGFSGVTTKDDPEYGLYYYKSSFGPEYIEQIGEFDYVRNHSAMKRYRFEKLAVNHVKRRIWRMRFAKKK